MTVIDAERLENPRHDLPAAVVNYHENLSLNDEDLLLLGAMKGFILSDTDPAERHLAVKELDLKIVDYEAVQLANIREEKASEERSVIEVMKSYILSDTDPQIRLQSAQELDQKLVDYGAPQLANISTNDDRLPPPDLTVKQVETKPTIQTTPDLLLKNIASETTPLQNALSKAVNKKLRGGYATGSEALHLSHTSWEDIQRVKQQSRGSKVRQNEIVAAPYVSMAESLIGDRKRGLLIGLHAAKLALKSESSKIVGNTPNLPMHRRLGSKAKSLRAGLTAVAVSAMASPRMPILKNKAWSLAAHHLK